MGKETEIAWCDSTVNPMMGCDGCELRTKDESHCYAAAHCARYAGTKGYPKSFDQPALFPERFKVAAKWSDLTGKDREDKPWLNGYPRVIFCCDLGDPLTESLPVDWLAPHLPLIEATPHIWIFCTKRPRRARLFFEWNKAPRNLWLLTTVTSQSTAPRIIEALSVPGISMVGVSLEPLLGPVNPAAIEQRCILSGELQTVDAFTGGIFQGGKKVGFITGGGLGWLVAGGESGPGARAANPEWFRSLRDQCQAAKVPFMFKQWGEFHPVTRTDGIHESPFGGHAMVRVGKAAAGRKLDGVEWLQMPEVPRADQ